MAVRQEGLFVYLLNRHIRIYSMKEEMSHD
jgi:hypothetical protein